MTAGDFMLIASQDVDIHEQYVYRYGFTCRRVKYSSRHRPTSSMTSRTLVGFGRLVQQFGISGVRHRTRAAGRR